MVNPLEKTELKVPLFFRGKVRDVYDLDDKLLIVATDRISAFDYILPTPIPEKGKILTQISIFWFEYLSDIVPNHIITTDIDQFPAELKDYRDVLSKRSMLVKKTNKINIECVVRGYLSGSGWKEYRATRSICGIKLPDGLVESDRLPQPIFTPATKEEKGKHDENISFKRMGEMIGTDLAAQLKNISLKLYQKAVPYAEKKGIIISDTKFEFGLVEGQLILIDEVLTPDSSRFWNKDKYQSGRSQASFDKQFVRDYLESIKWDKNPPVPVLPEEIVEKTKQRYNEAFKKLTT